MTDRDKLLKGSQRLRLSCSMVSGPAIALGAAGLIISIVGLFRGQGAIVLYQLFVSYLLLGLGVFIAAIGSVTSTIATVLAGRSASD